jgi:hypothetical protein
MKLEGPRSRTYGQNESKLCKYKPKQNQTTAGYLNKLSVIILFCSFFLSILLPKRITHYLVNDKG